MSETDVAAGSGRSTACSGADLRLERCSDFARWDEFIASHPDSTFCHASAWRHVFEDVLGHECEFLVALDESGAICGALPLTWVKAWPIGSYAISTPFLNYGGPIGTPAARTALANESVGLARARGVDLLELRTRLETECDLELNQRKLAVLLSLPEDVEDLWMGVLRSKTRTKVRRPQKAGMVTKFGPDQLKPFYRVFRHNMRDLGTPVLPIRFFQKILDLFGEHVHIGVVWTEDGVPVAAGFGLDWKGEFEITWGSSLREYNSAGPNMLLYWDLLERMVEKGMHTFNFGRSTPDGGTHDFKKQWGGDDVPLPWLQWSPGTLDATPNADQPLLRRASEVWSRLPRPIANRLGPFLARRLP